MLFRSSLNLNKTRSKIESFEIVNNLDKKFYYKTGRIRIDQKKLEAEGYKTFEAFNYHSFDGKDTELDDILKDAQMLPMMSEYNFVLVKDYPIEKSSNDIKLLEEYLSDAPDSTVLVFWFDALDPDVKSAKFKKVIKAFEKQGGDK